MVWDSMLVPLGPDLRRAVDRGDRALDGRLPCGWSIRTLARCAGSIAWGNGRNWRALVSGKTVSASGRAAGHLDG